MSTPVRSQGVPKVINLASSTPKQRVLVVEDDLDTVHSMAVLVKMMGHECQFAINGFAALEIARRFQPHIVFLDIGLPDFKGHEVAQQLRWEPGLERTRLIALTGLSEEDPGMQRALDAGCEAIYRKPVAPATFEAIFGGETLHTATKKSGAP